MNILRAILLASLLTTPALAQPILSSSVETGWTSNAQAAAGGSPDSYLTHTHSIALAAEGLRGTIAFEGIRFSRLWRENDWTASVNLGAETLLGPETGLRGSLALVYGEEGRSAASVWGPLGLVTPTLSGTASIRGETRLGGALIGFDLAYAARRPGETRVEAGLLPDSRTEPRTDTITAGIDAIAPVSPALAVAGRAQYRTVLVSEEDQAIFNRLPVSVVRLGGGIDFGSGTPTGIVLRGGLDVIVSQTAISSLLVPHAEAQARLQLTETFGLHAGLMAGADVEDPTDGLADWRLEARGGFRLTPATGFGIDAVLFAAQSRSPALDLTIETEHGAELVARWEALDGLTLEALARHRLVAGLAPAYEETRLALRVSAAI